MSLSELSSPIFLLGMPRSGTTWLSQIIESSPDVIVRLSPNYSYKLKNRLTVNSGLSEWQSVLSQAIDSDDKFLTQNWRRETGELSYFSAQREHTKAKFFIKDTRFHDVYQAGMDLMERARIVYIVRHPAAALWSWSQCKEFPEGANFQEEWRAGNCRKHEGPGEYWGFDDWKHLTAEYLKREAENPQR